jgi:ABC-type bacteriocin/lantibiotic exporter with double-glycine peptidase domain
VDDVLEHPQDPEVAVRPSTGALPDRLSGRVELRGVTFGYNPSQPPLLDKIDLVIEPGQRLALVGGSGSGKSTLAKLVAGLLTPWSGTILLDGRPRSEWPRETLAASFALVEQDVHLFSGTVRDNLTLWDPTVPDEVLLDACRDAGILDHVLSLPGALDASLLELGANLSGGQRQRLDIARALAHSPAVLVLDEATAALDAETEARVIQGIRRRGAATVVVAHRLNTVRDADHIVVLAGSKLVERGTHDQLVAKGGEYARLIAAGAKRS